MNHYDGWTSKGIPLKMKAIVKNGARRNGEVCRDERSKSVVGLVDEEVNELVDDKKRHVSTMEIYIYFHE